MLVFVVLLIFLMGLLGYVLVLFVSCLLGFVMYLFLWCLWFGLRLVCVDWWCVLWVELVVILYIGLLGVGEILGYWFLFMVSVVVVGIMGVGVFVM